MQETLPDLFERLVALITQRSQGALALAGEVLHSHELAEAAKRKAEDADRRVLIDLVCAQADPPTRQHAQWTCDVECKRKIDCILFHKST